MKYRFILFASFFGFLVAGCGSDDLSDTSPTAQNTESRNNIPDSSTENPMPSGSSEKEVPPGNNDDQGTSAENTEIDHTDDWIGPMSPEDALEYMKSTYHQGLVIVDVTPLEHKLETGFTGSISIPYTELDTRSDEIPPEKPVILHCVRGNSSAKAYPILEETRKDIPVLSYIAGEPLIEDFNTWVQSQDPTP